MGRIACFGMGIRKALHLKPAVLLIGDCPAKAGSTAAAIGAGVARPAFDDDVMTLHDGIIPLGQLGRKISHLSSNGSRIGGLGTAMAWAAR